MSWFVVVELLSIGAFLGFAVGWIAAKPQLKALALKMFKQKNYVIALIREAGGQLKFRVVPREGNKIQTKNKIFNVEAGRDHVNYIGSIPVYAFNSSDCSSLNLREPEGVSSDARAQYRAPEHMHGIFMHLKALLESKASDAMRSLMLLTGIQTIVLAIILILSYLTFASTGALEEQLPQQVGQQINNALVTGG